MQTDSQTVICWSDGYACLLGSVAGKISTHLDNARVGIEAVHLAIASPRVDFQVERTGPQSGRSDRTPICEPVQFWRRRRGFLEGLLVGFGKKRVTRLEDLRAFVSTIRQGRVP